MMTQPQAGWYPDPSGNVAKLRYWDGVQWTESYMDNPQMAAQNPGASFQVEATAVGATPQPAQTQDASQASQPVYVQQTVYSQPVQGQQDSRVQTSQAAYSVTKEDQTLRLIAFIFCLISTISVCWLLIPLAWMIPMTVMSWGIYKGTRANTTAFGVCTLIFVSIVSGILLLVSTKDD